MSLYDAVKNADNPYQAFQEAVSDLVSANRFPLSAVFELSPVCNFKCPFCYARVSPEELAARGEKVLRFADWKRFIDEARAMGTFKLTLTGGECMLHPDFCEIYRYAYAQGCELTLMTNGSCVTPEILEMFRDCPPEGVYLTLYGSSPETYETVCGSAAFYDRVLRNIRALKELGLLVVLQFTADRDNVAELETVYALSKALDAPLRYTVAEQSFRRCTPEMLEEFAPEQELLHDAARAIYLDRSGLTEEAYDAAGDEPVQLLKMPVIEKGMPCGAGRNSFCINYRGEMLPCVVFDAVSVKTDGRLLSDCWKELVRGCDEIPRLVECTNCIHRMHCRSCIAQHYNACKQFGVPAPRLCWKQKYPERAAEIEKFYAEHGYLRRKDIVV